MSEAIELIILSIIFENPEIKNKDYIYKTLMYYILSKSKKITSQELLQIAINTQKLLDKENL